MPTKLIIPMQAQAWVVSSDTLKPGGVEHQERSAPRRWSLNFNNLDMFSSPVFPPFAGEDDFRGIGVHVHWTLPSGFRHGQAKDKQSPIEFPVVPNRWLVIRFYGSLDEKRQSKAWVIESDFLHPLEGTSTFPDPKSTGQTRIGRAMTLAAWEELESKKRTATSTPDEKKDQYLEKKLTAVANGDPAFSAFQPYHQNVFSFYDKLEVSNERDSDIIRTDNLSYCIIGWYSDSQNDPFTIKVGARSKDDFGKLLQRYHCSLDAKGIDDSQINGLLCHGMVNAIPWDREAPVPSFNEKSPNPKEQKPINPGAIRVALGPTSIDALGSLVNQMSADQSSQLIPQELWSALSHGLLDKMETLDGEEEIEHTIHQAEFGTHPGGVAWSVITESKEIGSVDAKEDPIDSALPPECAAVLQELNFNQDKLEQTQRMLQTRQYDLYTLWWKKGSLDNYPPPETDTAEEKLLQKLKSDLEQKDGGDSLYQKCLAEIKKLQTIVTGYTGKIERLKTQLEQQLSLSLPSSTLKRSIKEHPKPQFWHSKDPAILITGIRSPWSDTSTDVQLPCRVSSQLLTRIEFKDEGKAITFPDKCRGVIPEFKQFSDDVKEAMNGLLRESFLLDPSHAPFLAQESGLSAEKRGAFINEVNNPSTLTLLKGMNLPAYGLGRWWCQPWHPLFLEWRIKWYQIPYDNWEYDPEHKQYAWRGNRAAGKPVVQTLRGRNLLMPQANFTLKGQIKSTVQQDASLMDQEQTLLHLVDEWDVLSATLGGFNEELVMRDVRINRIPNAEAIEEKEAATWIKEECRGAPLPGSLSAEESSFNPLRQGQFYIEQISVVDRFGQAINLIRDGLRPIVSASLQPQMLVDEHLSQYQFIQLCPRIVQNTRLHFEWISGKEDEGRPLLKEKKLTDTESFALPVENPVCGWILPNYLERALQIYDDEGIYLGEIRLSKKETVCDWVSTSSITAVKNPFLKHLIGQLTSSRIAPATCYKSLWELLDEALSTKVLQDSKHSSYFSALIGRPLALVRSSWQLELEQPPYKDQSWRKTPQMFNEQGFEYPYFPITLGNRDLNKDGLIGYFATSNFSKFYSPYITQVTDEFVQPTTGKHFYLKPAFGNDPTAKKQLTLLIDPFAKIHAYSDLLPVFDTLLPGNYIHSALKRITVTFKMGPFITPRYDLPSKLEDKRDKVISLPAPYGNSVWSWHDPTQSQKIALKPVDTTARFESSLMMVEGSLILDSVFEEEKQRTSLTNRNTLFQPVKDKLYGTFKEELLEFDLIEKPFSGADLIRSRAKLFNQLQQKLGDADVRRGIAQDIVDRILSGHFQTDEKVADLVKNYRSAESALTERIAAINKERKLESEKIKDLNDLKSLFENTVPKIFEELTSLERNLNLANNTLLQYGENNLISGYLSAIRASVHFPIGARTLLLGLEDQKRAITIWKMGATSGYNLICVGTTSTQSESMEHWLASKEGFFQRLKFKTVKYSTEHSTTNSL